jgi:hypothetical protein
VFVNGTNDKWTVHTVTGVGRSRTAATAARGSSGTRSRRGRGLPGTSSGIVTFAAGISR